LFPLGSLTAGHKKDVVITNQLLGEIGKTNVAIYGWHRSNRDPIQYLYVRHLNSWVDYSHGIRLVSNRVILNGKPLRLPEIFMDPIYSKLISEEGRISFSKYPSDVELVFRKQK
jgi:hypothetical protein